MRPHDGLESGNTRIDEIRREKQREDAESRRDAERRAEADALAPFGFPASTTLYDPIDGATFLNSVDPPLEYAIKPMVLRSEITEVNGGNARFKSTLVLDMICSIAAGKPWGGYDTIQGPAVFISMEDLERLIRARIYAWIMRFPADERSKIAETLARNLFVLGREHARGYAMTEVFKGQTKAVPVVITKLKEIAKGKIAVALETASRLHAGEESNEDLSVFAWALEDIATASGAAIITVRHQSKSDARANSVDSYTGRGGGALADAVRGMFVVTRPDGDDPLRPIVVYHVKNQYGPTERATHWAPVPVKVTNGIESVHLRHMDRSEVARSVADQVFAAIEERKEAGIKHGELMKMFRREDGRTMLEVVVRLIDSEMITERTERQQRGRPARMYRAREWSDKVRRQPHDR